MGTPTDAISQLGNAAIGEINGEHSLMAFPFFPHRVN